MKTKSLEENWKLKHPSLIDNEYRSTKECLHYSQVNQFPKGSSTPIVLTYPFLFQGTKMVTQNSSSSSQKFANIMMMFFQPDQVMVAT